MYTGTLLRKSTEVCKLQSSPECYLAQSTILWIIAKRWVFPVQPMSLCYRWPPASLCPAITGASATIATHFRPHMHVHVHAS